MSLKTKGRFENRFLKSLSPYKVSSQEAWKMAEDEDVLKLDWNESTVAPSPKVLSALEAGIKGKLNWYPNVDNRELTKRLAEYAGVGIDFVQYFSSSDDLHEYVIRAFCSSEDRITIVSPTYDNFRVIAESMGALVKFFHLDSDFKFQIEDFNRHVKETDSKLVYLCNPNNPSGTEYNLEVLTNILSENPDRFFIVDEAYFEFGGHTAVPLTSKFDNLLITRTFSKAFGLASFRVGYAISDAHNIAILNKIRNPKSIAALSQAAALAALEDVAYMRNYVKEVLLAKQEFAKGLKKLGFRIHAGAGNFVLVELEKKRKSELIHFLQNQKIFLRDYSHVPRMENFFRITIGTREQMIYVTRCIQGFLESERKSA